jgi:two-component system phosphate regulon sensor histidine kinase PhoR
VFAAARQFDPVLEQEGFHITTEADGEEHWVMADRDALVQALLNLLNNAVKYSGTSREIGLSVRARGGDAEVCVTDRGRGIRRTQQARIFESFYRSPEAALDTSGAGLGLALVRHFAEAHGGRVKVSSELGKGSTFSLWLPLLKTQGNQEAGLPRPAL